MQRDNSVNFLAIKKQEIVHLLDALGQQIEITEAQYEEARTRYEAVGSWLSQSTSPYLHHSQIYPQGSVALGTAIKPSITAEFDVDLVCLLPLLDYQLDAKFVKALIGDRLKEHSSYKEMLIEKRRCWRINYANKFHLDITPSINNPHCYQGGELVPDKELSKWKPTNPRGYIRKFDQYAAMKPTFSLIHKDAVEARAAVAPLPEQTMSKPILKRIVQLLKRHRDKKFMNTPQSNLAPISIIITTLAGRSYAKGVGQVYADAFDFITAVIRNMPTFIHGGAGQYVIENETTMGENFAEKWNSDERLAKAFYEWHADVLSAVESLLQTDGIDRITEGLSNKFGVSKENILSSIIAPIGKARSDGLLAVSPVVGIINTPALGSMPVRNNKFYGL